jgi:hypothetical protein
MISTVDQANIVVMLVKVVLVNVLDLVLENRVKMIPTAEHMDIVVIQLIKHAP